MGSILCTVLNPRMRTCLPDRACGMHSMKVFRFGLYTMMTERCLGLGKLSPVSSLCLTIWTCLFRKPEQQILMMRDYLLYIIGYLVAFSRDENIEMKYSLSKSGSGLFRCSECIIDVVISQRNTI